MAICRRFSDVSRRPLVICSLLLVVFYLEYFSHYMASWKWADPESVCKRMSSSGSYVNNNVACLRIMLIADPQLQGYRNEPPGFAGSLFRFDSDWYMRKTFQFALSHIKPDLIIFLGDLLDEGSIIDNDKEYTSTVSRFYSIFKLPPDTAVIYIPGDNDIGGEGGEPIRPAAQRRFQDAFTNHFPTQSPIPASQDRSKVKLTPEEFILLKLAFFEADYFTGLWSQLKPNPGNSGRQNSEVASNESPSKDAIRVLLSHASLIETFSMTRDSFQVVRSIRPALAISGHTHLAAYRNRSLEKDPHQHNDKVMSQPYHLGPLKTHDLNPQITDPIFMNLVPNAGIHEIVVPTCSYRMGVPQMGYGLLALSYTGGASVGNNSPSKISSIQGGYSVLWTPGRFGQLYVYLAFLILIGFYGLIRIIAMCCNPLTDAFAGEKQLNRYRSSSGILPSYYGSRGTSAALKKKLAKHSNSGYSRLSKRRSMDD